MKAIHTKVLPATTHKGTRVKAWAHGSCSVVVPKDYDLDDFGTHAAAARALCEKYDWHGHYVAGGSADGCGFVFVDIRGVRMANLPVTDIADVIDIGAERKTK